MLRRLRGRQPGQTLVFAALAMMGLVGGVALVVDTGIFFVVQRQLQSAADAGALAGAWYDPVCPATAAGCRRGSAEVVAVSVAQANADTVSALCGGKVNVDKPALGSVRLRLPSGVPTIVVTVWCDAGYSFGRILGLTSKHISASAAAAISDRAANGDITNFSTGATNSPTPGVRIARLIE